MRFGGMDGHSSRDLGRCAAGKAAGFAARRVFFSSCCEFCRGRIPGGWGSACCAFAGFHRLAVLFFGLVGLVWSLSAQASPASSDVSVPSVVAGIDRSTIPVAPVAAVSQASFEGTGLVDRRSWADVDADGVPDVVEDALCGVATCANPWDEAPQVLGRSYMGCGSRLRAA